MSELDPNKEVELFPFKETVTIEVSGYFYSKIWSSLLHYCSEKQTTIAKTLEELKNRNPENAYEEHILMLLTLTNSIETAAKEQGKLVKKKASELPQVEPPTPGAPEN